MLTIRYLQFASFSDINLQRKIFRHNKTCDCRNMQFSPKNWDGCYLRS